MAETSIFLYMQVLQTNLQNGFVAILGVVKLQFNTFVCINLKIGAQTYGNLRHWH